MPHSPIAPGGREQATGRPAARRDAKPRTKAPRARDPSAPTRVTRVHAAGEKDAARLGKAPVIEPEKAPLAKRVWDWLLEDPGKHKRKAKDAKRLPERVSHRDVAARRIEAEDAEKRKAARDGFLAGFLRTDKLLPEAFRRRGEPRPVSEKLHPELDGPGAYRQPVPIEEAAEAGIVSKPSRITLWLDDVLGIRREVDTDGDIVVSSETGEDWRWRMHRFLRGQNRLLAYSRATVFTFAIVLILWGTIFASTGFNMFALAVPTEAGDEMGQFKIPVFVIESGSMMHDDAPYGRLGTIDPGDLAIVQKVSDDPEEARQQIQTFYGEGDRRVAGAKGDVIMYLPPVVDPKSPPSDPIIHRAVAYIEVNQRIVPNPEFGKNPLAEKTIAVKLYTVEEFGIVDASTVTIPELGLADYTPRFSGYITRGDNSRTNNLADQAIGVSAHPVPTDRIIGRYIGEVPYIGLAKVAFQGQNPAVISADEQWCSFLLGQGPCDSWQIFLVLSGAFIGGPLVWAFVVLGRRAYVRRLDALVLAEREAQEQAYAQEAERREEEDPRPVLTIHSAEDLLAGRVSFPGQRQGRGDYAAWRRSQQAADRREDGGVRLDE